MSKPVNYGKYSGFKANAYMKAAGWSKIIQVTVDRQHDEYGRVTDEHVSMLTEDGDWFMLDGLRHDDPPADKVAEMYSKRGWTDSRCIFMGKAKVND